MILAHPAHLSAMDAYQQQSCYNEQLEHKSRTIMIVKKKKKKTTTRSRTGRCTSPQICFSHMELQFHNQAKPNAASSSFLFRSANSSHDPKCTP